MLLVFEARRGRRGRANWGNLLGLTGPTVRKGEERFLASLGMTTFTVRSLANFAVLDLRIYDWSG
jgi:hypothetical protein